MLICNVCEKYQVREKGPMLTCSGCFEDPIEQSNLNACHTCGIYSTIDLGSQVCGFCERNKHFVVTLKEAIA